MAASLEQARAAKTKLSEHLEAHEAVRGIGVARLEDGYGVKVNLACPVEDVVFPDELDGVKVVVEVVGQVRKRSD
jgi:hypothetical protein